MHLFLKWKIVLDRNLETYFTIWILSLTAHFYIFQLHISVRKGPHTKSLGINITAMKIFSFAFLGFLMWKDSIYSAKKKFVVDFFKENPWLPEVATQIAKPWSNTLESFLALKTFQTKEKLLCESHEQRQ